MTVDLVIVRCPGSNGVPYHLQLAIQRCCFVMMSIFGARVMISGIITIPWSYPKAGFGSMLWEDGLIQSWWSYLVGIPLSPIVCVWEFLAWVIGTLVILHKPCTLTFFSPMVYFRPKILWHMGNLFRKEICGRVFTLMICSSLFGIDLTGLFLWMVHLCPLNRQVLIQMWNMWSGLRRHTPERGSHVRNTKHSDNKCSSKHGGHPLTEYGEQ